MCQWLRDHARHDRFPAIRHVCFCVSPRTQQTQIVAAEEYSIEPRLTFKVCMFPFLFYFLRFLLLCSRSVARLFFSKVALTFIEQVHSAMVESATAWKQRYEWER